jgi:hypothetical protein
MEPEQIHVIQEGTTWKILLGDRKKALSVFRNRDWFYPKQHAIENAFWYAYRHVPADIIMHSGDGTVEGIYEVRKRYGPGLLSQGNS